MQLLFGRPADFFNIDCVASQGHRYSVRQFGAALWREPIFNRAAYDAQTDSGRQGSSFKKQGHHFDVQQASACRILTQTEKFVGILF